MKSDKVTEVEGEKEKDKDRKTILFHLFNTLMARLKWQQNFCQFIVYVSMLVCFA